jgi:Ulp1 family protease
MVLNIHIDTYQVPQQTNNSDCGFYVVDFFATFLSNPDACRAAMTVRTTCPPNRHSIFNHYTFRLPNKTNHPRFGGIHPLREPSFAIVGKVLQKNSMPDFSISSLPSAVSLFALHVKI